MNVSNDNTNIFQKAACSAAGVYVANKLPKFVRKNNPLIKPAIKAMDSISVPKKQMDVFIHLMLNEPVLKKSNFKAVEVTSKNVKDLSNSFTEKLFKFSKNDKNLEKIRDIYQKKILKLFKLVEKGKNAFYSPIDNVAYYPKNKPFFLAHEIGHAINDNTAKASKIFIMSGRILPGIAMLAVPAIAIWQSFKNKNADDKTFLQKHAGKIVGAAFLPMLAEEATASMRAISTAKLVNFSKEAMKNMKLGYGLAFSTYVSFAVVSALSATLVTKLFSKKVKD